MLTTIPKNIHRSAFQHIQDNYTKSSIFYEGQTQSGRVPPLIEVRLNGPSISSESKGFVRAEFEVNLLLQVSVRDNMYALDEMAGELLDILYSGIVIEDENGAPIGCASPKFDRRDEIEINRFGLIDPQSELIQATVSVKFEVTLEI